MKADLLDPMDVLLLRLYLLGVVSVELVLRWVG